MLKKAASVIDKFLLEKVVKSKKTLAAASIFGGAQVTSFALGRQQQEYQAYTGDESLAGISDSVRTGIRAGGYLGAASAYLLPMAAKGLRGPDGKMGMLGKGIGASLATGAVGMGIGAGLYAGGLGSYILPGMAIGAAAGVGSVAGLAAIKFRGALGSGLMKNAPGLTAFAGGAAMGGYFGSNVPIRKVGEGNITSVTTPSQANRRLNYSTAGLVQALHRNRRM